MFEVFFTADLHLNHNKEFIYKARGFNSVEEMNFSIIENINKNVKFDDEIWILGDLLLGDSLSGVKLLKEINGYKHIIFGNHCTLRRQEYYKYLLRTEIHGYADLVRFKKQSLYLSHYPVIMSNGNEKVPVCLHGHTHSSNPLEYIQFNCINVGLDAWDCRPVHIDTIKELIKNKG